MRGLLAQFRTALALGPDDANVLWYVADAYEISGRSPPDAAFVEKALQGMAAYEGS